MIPSDGCSAQVLAGERRVRRWPRGRPAQAKCWFGCKRGARKVNPSQPSQGSHPQADTDKLKITGCVKATWLNLSRCGFHCALASLAGLRVPGGLFASFCKVSIFGRAGGGACRVPHRAKQGGSSSQPLCREKSKLFFPGSRSKEEAEKFWESFWGLVVFWFFLRESLDFLLSPGCVYRNTLM